jgi:hypothetical protein
MNREVLWVRLEHMGVRGKLLAMVKSMYEGATVRVRLGGQLSEPFEGEVGVWQGRITSPTFWTVMFEELLERYEEREEEGHEEESKASIYADDLIVSTLSIREVKIMMEEAARWAEERGLSFGEKKYEVVRMGRAQKGVRMIMMPRGERVVLEIQDTMEVLGVQLGERGVDNKAQCLKVLGKVQKKVEAMKWLGVAGKMEHVEMQGWLMETWMVATIRANAVLVEVTEENMRVISREGRKLALWTIGLKGKERQMSTLELMRQLGWKDAATEVVREKIMT